MLPSLQFASKNIIFIPEMQILPGEPLQKQNLYPRNLFFLPVDPLETVFLWKPGNRGMLHAEMFESIGT